MLKRYEFWLKTAVGFQFVTAALHATSLFVNLRPKNETEERLIGLLNTYKFDLGRGFHPTFSNMFTALSSCFSFVCLLGGLMLGYLLLKNADPKLMKGIIGINLTVFGAIFVVMAMFTFLPPIILTGSIFVNLLAAYVFVSKTV